MISRHCFILIASIIAVQFSYLCNAQQTKPTAAQLEFERQWRLRRAQQPPTVPSDEKPPYLYQAQQSCPDEQALRNAGLNDAEIKTIQAAYVQGPHHAGSDRSLRSILKKISKNPRLLLTPWTLVAASGIVGASSFLWNALINACRHVDQKYAFRNEIRSKDGLPPLEAKGSAYRTAVLKRAARTMTKKEPLKGALFAACTMAAIFGSYAAATKLAE